MSASTASSKEEKLELKSFSWNLPDSNEEGTVTVKLTYVGADLSKIYDPIVPPCETCLANPFGITLIGSVKASSNFMLLVRPETPIFMKV